MAPSPVNSAFFRSQDIRDDGLGAHAEEEHETQQHIVELSRPVPVPFIVHSGTSSVSVVVFVTILTQWLSHKPDFLREWGRGRGQKSSSVNQITPKYLSKNPFALLKVCRTARPRQIRRTVLR